MKLPKLPVVTVGAFLAGVGAAYATTITVTGTYSITYHATAGNGPTFTDRLSSPFTENLTLGVPTANLNFFTASPNGSCGYGCVNNTASGTITVTFGFTLPNGATGNLAETGTYQAKYSGSALPCTTSPAGQTDCVDWSSSNDPIMVNFSNGDTLAVRLYNAQDWAITPQLSFLATAGLGGGQHVPGPIVGAGLPGVMFAGGGLLEWWRRRRHALTSSASSAGDARMSGC